MSNMIVNNDNVYPLILDQCGRINSPTSPSVPTYSTGRNKGRSRTCSKARCVHNYVICQGILDSYILLVFDHHMHPPLVYEADKVIPLPTYDQSQKYEQDGVLDIEEDEEDLGQRPMMSHKLPGTCLDFTLFFFCKFCVQITVPCLTTQIIMYCLFALSSTVVSFFGVVGFIFSICFAFTTAAEGGALAGLGLTFVSNLLTFEVSSGHLLCVLCVYF